MTRLEHLLTILMEECGEVAQRASKALRFGLHEVQPGQGFTNSERIYAEWFDLLAVFEMLQHEADGPGLPPYAPEVGIRGKKEKVEEFLKYSAKLGTVDAPAEPPAENLQEKLYAHEIRTGGCEPAEPEMVDHPKHYNSLGAECLQCGRPIECVDVNEHFPGNMAAAIKYLWRSDHKAATIQDLEKAIWYIRRQIDLIERRAKKGDPA